MKLDPTKMKDWQIAEAAEETLRPVRELAAELGLKPEHRSKVARARALAEE